MTRGERNNNPCNIRISNAPWLGKANPSQDPAFEQFDEVQHGIRAAANLFLSYHKLYGLSTVTQLISRWAPSNENDTDSYVADVCSRMGVGAGDSLDLTDTSVLSSLVSAVIWHENGENPYSTDEINAACASA